MHVISSDVTAPAVLFPAISLLLLAYTNRFLAIAALIRALHQRYTEFSDPKVLDQITNLRHRLKLIRLMQEFGVLSLLLCVIAMFLIFANQPTAGKWIFGSSLVVLMISLAYSIREIHMSVQALHLQLSDIHDYHSR